MKKMIAAAILLGLLSSSSMADCKTLMSQYNAPDTSTSLMRKLKRWVKRGVKRGKIPESDKQVLLDCLIDRAADNPNRATVAGQ